jgi:hypothetical protein
MRKRYVNSITVILKKLKIITRPDLRRENPKHTRLFKSRIARQRRRFAGSEIGENETEIVLSRVVFDANLLCKAFILSRLLDTFPGTIVLPTVIATSNEFSFDATGRELCSAMRTSERYNVRSTALASIQCKIFTHDSNWLRMAARQIFPTIYRLPK